LNCQPQREKDFLFAEVLLRYLKRIAARMIWVRGKCTLKNIRPTTKRRRNLR
jgi:hypothetical protein